MQALRAGDLSDGRTHRPHIAGGLRRGARPSMPHKALKEFTTGIGARNSHSKGSSDGEACTKVEDGLALGEELCQDDRTIVAVINRLGRCEQKKVLGWYV